MASVLIYRIGSLGDTLVALPAMWAVRHHFADAHITLLCDHHPHKNYVLAPDLLAGSGVVDDFLLYPVDNSRMGRLFRPWRMARLLATLRKRKFDTLVYLAPTGRIPHHIGRDRRFFQAARVRQMIGMNYPPMTVSRLVGQPVATMPREADLLLDRLAGDGIPIPALNQGRADLNLGPREEQQVHAWLAGLPDSGNRPWISFGPGTKQPVNRWPVKNYIEVGQALIDEFDIWPVIFGGPEDQEDAREMITHWGRGYIAAGALGLRASAAALHHCVLHVGNDTGTLHLASAAGVRCVGVFSGRNPIGLWHPYGEGHTVLRNRIECEGCLLSVCIERKMQCILSITPQQVVVACQNILSDVPAGGPRVK